MIYAPQAKSERIEQLESDLNISEKVSFAQTFRWILFRQHYLWNWKVGFLYSKLKTSESFIWLNKKWNWTWNTSSRIAWYECTEILLPSVHACLYIYLHRMSWNVASLLYMLVCSDKFGKPEQGILWTTRRTWVSHCRLERKGVHHLSAENLRLVSEL